MAECPAYYPANHGQDLTDWVVRHGRSLADLVDLLAHAVTVEQPKEPEQDAGVSRFFNGRKFAPALLAQAIMADLSVVSDPLTGLVYRWEGRFWAAYDLSHIRSKALVMLGIEGSSARAADVANMVRDLSTLPVGRRMNDHDDLICLENGMFNLRSGELLRHEKDHFATYMLPISFDPANVPDCPTWKRCLDQWLSDKASIIEAQKFAGYCLTRETRWEKMLLMYGPGGDGKSTFSNILREMVGPENCSHIPMGRLEDQFYLSRLVDKLINMSTEIEAKAMQSHEIKAIVSGDPVCASFKNQTPFDFVPFAKLIYSTNRLPKMLDNSDGFFRKIMILRFEGQFVKRGGADIFLKDKLMAELPGIFAWALMGLVLLREEGFKPTVGMEESLSAYKTINNNVLYFIEQHVEARSDAKVGKAQVYAEYVSRCKGWNLMPVGEPLFRQEFLRLLRDRELVVRDGKVPSADGSKRLNAYCGFELVEEKCDEVRSPSPAPLPSEAAHV